MNLQDFRCQCCGASFEGIHPEQDDLCSDCSMRAFIATLDEQKLAKVREQIHSHHMILAIHELRTQFNLNFRLSVDVADFLRRQEEASRESLQNSEN